MRIPSCAGAAAVSMMVLAVSLVVAWSPARADSCLEHFSCQLYGPCPLPCLDRLMGGSPSHPQVPPVAPPTAPPAADNKLADAPSSPPPVQRPKPVKAARVAHSKAPSGEHLAIVRVVAGRGITSLAELAGKPVSFGPEGDAGEIVGRRMFAKLGVKVAETPLTFDNAIDGVGTGDVAAVVVLHARDIAKLKALSPKTLHLLAVPAGSEPPADMTATALSLAAAGPLAHGHSLRAFAVAVTDLPRLARHMASAAP